MEKTKNFPSVASLAESLQTNNATPRIGKIGQFLRKRVIAKLERLRAGHMTLIDGESQYQFKGEECTELKATVQVLDPEFYFYLAFGGSVGAGEAWIKGYWKSPDLTAVIRLFAVNQDSMDEMEKGLTALSKPLKKFAHWLNKNSESGSKRNIVAHYDLGNEFFQTFLDPTMMYSAGIFESAEDTMEQASLNKLGRICERLRLSADDHVVEIGTGWGSFAIYAAQNYGCRVTTTTISDKQYQLARQRIEALGLSDKITLLKKDYRQLQGQYDKLVSIEMIEAVGHHYYADYFAKCSELLKPGGEMLLQAITIQDQRYNSARKDIDFIKRYIFPGSCIPSINIISQHVTKNTNMRIAALDDIGLHYAETLNRWRQQFFSNIDKVRAQGFSEAFIRMWEFYLCYCEGGFREGVISDVHIHLVKPRAKVAMHLPKIKSSLKP
jgi:cyclopropane-fatty-acyl-phospholipid synthase